MDENGFEQLFGDGFEERHRKIVEQLEAKTRPLGLYLDFARVLPLDTKDRVCVQAGFTIGDLAWTPKALDPEQHFVDDQFKDITMDLDDDEVEELKRKFQNGELPWQKKTGEE